MFNSESLLEVVCLGLWNPFPFFAAFSDVPGLGQAINGNPLQPC